MEWWSKRGTWPRGIAEMRSGGTECRAQKAWETPRQRKCLQDMGMTAKGGECRPRITRSEKDCEWYMSKGIRWARILPLCRHPTFSPFRASPVKLNRRNAIADWRFAPHSASSRDYMSLLLEGHRDGRSTLSSTGSITLKGKGVPNLRRKPCTALSSA